LNKLKPSINVLKIGFHFWEDNVVTSDSVNDDDDECFFETDHFIVKPAMKATSIWIVIDKDVREEN